MGFNITAEKIESLRTRTQAGVITCKEALKEAEGDEDRAVEILKKQGAALVSKKADREAEEGLIEAYVHGNGKIGVLVEILCETDFVARSKEFKELCHNLAMQIAAMNPLYVSREDVLEKEIEKKKVEYRKEFKNEKKPKEVIDKIVQGKVDKFYEEVCLLEQRYIKTDDGSGQGKEKVKNTIEDAVSKLGENIEVGRFIRFEIGE
ncbi:elongation factor Ts [bacterium (Candidatus Torokbacteria) CG_4_10_14_0_2_um_filter_35_8]|nr:MAG: elongation factor Ts [bacterium (Candidatus Torokbacteria) CG_4_10_14_0_2_um_filter_35_8]